MLETWPKQALKIQSFSQEYLANYHILINFNTVWAGCPVKSSNTNFRHIAAFITSIGLAYDAKWPMINLVISIGNTNYEWWKIMPKTIYLQELELKVPAINSDWCMTPDCFKIISSLCVKVTLWLTKHFWLSFIYSMCKGNQLNWYDLQG